MKDWLKRSVFLVLLAGLCAWATGCAGETPGGTPGAPASSTVPSVSHIQPDVPKEPEPEEGKPEENKPEENKPEENKPEEIVPAPVEPLDLSTDGGVVIVGTVGHDEAGWFLTPEQPLNVEYHYFLNKPSRFDELMRIELFDSNVDGIEKLLYLGETVTIEGTFLFYRDFFDKLYMLPYTIHVGKTVQQSYADPELEAPDLTSNRYDPSEPLPEAMKSVVRDGQFTYNPFMLSQESLELMGNDFAAFYCEFVDAFLNYETQCPCPDEEFAQMLSTIIYFEFPLYDVCAESFEFVKHYDPDAATVTIAYKYDQATHRQKTDEFMDAANTFLSATSPEQSEAELAKHIYHELCMRVTYDHSAMTEFERKNALYAYMNHSGVCVTFANVYNQLLTQVGIRATTAQCDYTPTEGHLWSLVTVDGAQYFCDPTFELNVAEGAGYRYFGQTYAQRMADGLGLNGITAGRYYPYYVEESMLASEPLSVEK